MFPGRMARFKLVVRDGPSFPGRITRSKLVIRIEPSFSGRMAGWGGFPRKFMLLVDLQCFMNKVVADMGFKGGGWHVAVL